MYRIYLGISMGCIWGVYRDYRVCIGVCIGIVETWKLLKRVPS